MNYGSVCSGIEAATMAWHPLGWTPAFFSEIEAFPSAVLAHHYPTVPNHGDMTRFQEWPDAALDVLVGGTPCQSFSVAGLRKGMADPRGNLALVYLALADRYRPRWVVWENVPGVLSSNGGRDFGAFLGGLGQLGYGFAYRVLDAQYFGLAQRRRRVFVVGYLGDWRRAAAVLFERHSLSGNPAPSREAGEGTARSVEDGAGVRRSHWDGDFPHPTLNQSASGSGGVGASNQEIFSQRGAYLAPAIPPLARCDTTGEAKRQDYETCTIIPAIAHTLRAEGFDAGEDGTGRGTPLVPISFGWQNSSSQGDSASEDVTPTLDKSKTPAVAIALRGREGGATAEVGDDCGHALRASQGGGDKPHVLTGMAVRRLTPRECERLQGFPDDFTAIPWRGRTATECPDGPRYKALGNSMAVPCMAWIGGRIAEVEAMSAKEIAA